MKRYTSGTNEQSSGNERRTRNLQTVCASSSPKQFLKVLKQKRLLSKTRNAKLQFQSLQKYSQLPGKIAKQVSLSIHRSWTKTKTNWLYASPEPMSRKAVCKWLQETEYETPAPRPTHARASPYVACTHPPQAPNTMRRAHTRNSKNTGAATTLTR